MPALDHRVILSVILLTALPAHAGAAEINTYRAGQAYLKTVAQSPDQCAVQCRGDAQCRGWNFVVPNANAKSGICEFNARSAAPTFSPISISGAVQTGVDPLMSRAVPGGTRTIRVGTPQIVKPKPQIAQKPQSRRIVKREPVPAQTRPATPASTQTPTDIRKPRVYGGPKPAQSSQRPAPQARPQLTREQAFYRQQYLEAQKRHQMEMQRRAQQHAHYQRAPQHPQIAPTPPQFTAQSIPQSAPMPAVSGVKIPVAPTPRQAMPQQHPSLFGSLHDDLTKMTPVPRPQVAPDNPSDPDAPISTATPAPTKPVKTEKMKADAIPGLAGG